MPIRTEKRWGFPRVWRGGGMPRKISGMRLKRPRDRAPSIYIKGIAGQIKYG